MDTNSGHENPETNLEQLFDPEDYLFFYEEGLEGEQAEQEVAFIVRELNLSQPKRVLDAGCGYGRHANRLAALGHQVTGVDAARGMLDRARQDARDRSVSVRYLCENLLELEMTESFDCVISMSGSFGYGSDPENARILENFHRAIVAGGQLLLDLPGRDFFVRNFLPSVVEEKPGGLLIDLNRIDPLTGRLVVRRQIVREGSIREKPYSLRLYAPTELRDLLVRTGFSIIRWFGYYDSRPFDLTSRRLIVLAQKR